MGDEEGYSCKGAPCAGKEGGVNVAVDGTESISRRGGIGEILDETIFAWFAWFWNDAKRR